MRIVVIGQGGREHALAWRLSQEGHEIIAMPGNPGMEELGRCVKVSVSDTEGLVSACLTEKPDLVVVGPEAPLAAGIVDRLRAVRIPVFGPSQRAAQIEASKAYSKELMQRFGVPTARYLTVTSAAEIENALKELGGAVAVKADGLAAGKGVIVCGTVDEARAAAKTLIERGPVVIEERLDGPELSVIAITDGKHAAILPPARDHKRLLDRDQGPNTGGMGAIAPVPVSDELMEQIRREVIHRTLDAMAADGTPFTGALFAGLMLTKSGPKTLEFNARFGDPETQAIVTSLSKGVSLAQLLLQATTGDVPDTILPTDGAACGIVLAAQNYPDTPRAGDAIEGLTKAKDRGALVFHAGTKRDGEKIVTNGGRVLAVMGRADSLSAAREKALETVREVRFEGMQYRSDIGATTTG
jgi:phosphoribosylamine--glycine ligase